MSFAELSLGASVLLPLLVGAVMGLLPHGFRRLLGAITAVVVAGLVVPVVVHIAGGEVIEVPLGEYGAPLGIVLRADGLSAVFLALTAVVGLGVTIFAAIMPESTGVMMQPDANPKNYHPGFWPLWFGCWTGLNAVFTSGDLFNSYVGLELVGLTAVGLVALGGSPAWPGALRYLFIAVLGSILFLIAVGMIVSITGTLDINQATQHLVDNPDTHGILVVAMVLLSVGLAMKLALMPVHQWLIPAHASAPSAVSPLLSALVIKAAVFVFLRCWVWMTAPVFSPMLNEAATDPRGEWSLVPALSVLAWVFATLGVVALVVGAVLAMRQTHLKPLIAYSTVAQVGYWFLFLPTLLIPSADPLAEPAVTFMDSTAVVAGALAGTVALVLGHGLAKAALFLVAGYLKEIYGTDELDKLQGVARARPLLVMTMAMAAIGLAGLPFSLSFAGKWQLTSASLSGGHYWMLPVIVIATLGSAAYLLRGIAPLFKATNEDGSALELPKPVRTAPSAATQAAPLSLGLLTLATGFMGAPIFSLLDVGAPWM